MYHTPKQHSAPTAASCAGLIGGIAGPARRQCRQAALVSLDCGWHCHAALDIRPVPCVRRAAAAVPYLGPAAYRGLQLRYRGTARALRVTITRGAEPRVQPAAFRRTAARLGGAAARGA